MESRENPVFGRKVFFVNASITTEHYVTDTLHEQEYEVYTIEDYRMVKPILRDNKDALCFIDIDSQLTFKQWFNFILSFQQDPALKSIFFGVISSKATAADCQFFLMNLPLPGGFNFLDSKIENFMKTLIGILDINGAKGNRKYIRLTCGNIKQISAYIADKGKLHDLNVENISSVGMACTFSSALSGIFEANHVYDNISLTVGRKSMVCPCVVLRATATEVVLLFTKQVTNSERQEIKTFIHDVLRERFDGIKSNTILDLTKYADAVDIQAFTNLSSAQAPMQNFDGNDSFANLESLDDLEDIDL